MMTSYTVRRDNMIPMNFKGYPTDSITVVLRNEADAEIEKARREGRDEVLQSRLSEHWPNVQKRLEESARADERERIVQIIKGLYSNRGTVTTHQLHEILDCIASLPPQEPKPLERFGPNEI